MFQYNDDRVGSIGSRWALARADVEQHPNDAGSLRGSDDALLKQHHRVGDINLELSRNVFQHAVDATAEDALHPLIGT